VREVTDLVNHVVDVVTEALQYRAGLGLAALAEAVGSEAEPDSQRRQTLLNAVVKVLGNTLALRVHRRQYLARRTPSPCRHEEPDTKAAAFAI
jgi:hypothetical protein